MKFNRMAICLCPLISTPAFAESWDCKIPTLSFDQVEPWDVRGGELIGPSISDPPEPRRTFQIIMNNDKALIAFNNNDRADGAAINLIRISKADGIIQWRLVYMTGDYQERYDGFCLPAKR